MKDLIIPTKDITKNAIDASKDLGIVVGSMALTHGALTFAKKRDSLPVNLAVTGAGLAGATMCKPALGKLIFLGIAAYGAINSAGLAINKVAEPAKKEGVAGLIPEKLKEKLRMFIPQFAGVEELTGDDFSNIPSMDDAAVNGTEDINHIELSSTPGTAGMGAIEQAVASFA